MTNRTSRDTGRSTARRTGRRLPALLVAGALLALAGCSATPGSGDGVNELAVRRADAMRLIERAQQLAQQGKTEEAIRAYQESITQSPSIAVAWNNLGELYMRQQQYADAVSSFERAGDLEPQDPRPPYNAGVAYQKNGWAQDALGKFAEALERDAGYLPALRGAVRSAEMLNLADRPTLDRIKRATMTETDETWRAYFERQRFRVEHGLSQQAEAEKS